MRPHILAFFSISNPNSADLFTPFFRIRFCFLRILFVISVYLISYAACAAFLAAQGILYKLLTHLLENRLRSLYTYVYTCVIKK